MTDLVLARAAMAERLDGIGFPPAIVAAMASVPRHRFVPAPYWRLAYAETDLWLGAAWLAAPIVVARILAALAVRPGQRVLELGTGRGYQTALLAALGAEVFAIEPSGGFDLSDGALDAVPGLHRGRIHRSLGGDAAVWRDRAPFDAILVNTPLPEVPAALAEQLAPAHGRLVAPIGAPARLMVVHIGPDGALAARDAGVAPPRAGPPALGASAAIRASGAEP